MHGQAQEKEGGESYSSRFHSVLKRLAVGTSVAGIAAACAIIVLSLKGGDRELPKSDGSRSEEKRIICERASGDGLQDEVATNVFSTTGRPLRRWRCSAMVASLSTRRDYEERTMKFCALRDTI